QRQYDRQKAADQSKKRKSQQVHNDRRAAVLDAIAVFPDGETERAVREAAGLSGTSFGPIARELLKEGVIEQCDIQKQNGRKYSGFRLTGTTGQPSGTNDVPV